MEQRARDLVAEADNAAPARLPSLTGLRWLAAFGVFGFHILANQTMTSDPGFVHGMGVLFGAGASGVSLFFVLSGLVLTWSARPGDRPVRFWRRRAARVLPDHVVTWLCVLAMLALVGRELSAGPALAGLVLVQPWVPDEGYYFAVNTPAWSLACEAFFYAVFPWLVALVRAVPARRWWLLAVGLVAGVWAVSALATLMPEPLAYWFVTIFPVTRLLEFTLGICLALMIRNGRWRGPGVGVSAGFVAVAYLAAGLVPEPWVWVAWMAGPLALLVAALAAADARRGRGLLGHPWLIRLGEISFAFYLVHQPVIRLGTKLLGHDLNAVAVVNVSAGMLVVSVGLAWLLFRFVERPMERRLRPVEGGRVERRLRH
ncbi:acyltransferase family protein [Nonomuraea sp. KM88]|uniref:acyltransferase family protein n=1 Tax=Nonomuraea sp. KM88 TaxID=3457427 RepID=UPI003FCE5AA0